jgi:N-acetylneuraminic acid mutarotase
MKNLTLLFFILFSSITFSQKIIGKILDSETKEPIEKAHVFFINKTIYTNQDGEFSFHLNKDKSITFSTSHIKYQTQEITYKNNNNHLVIYLQEKQETLERIEIKTNKRYRNAIEFKKLVALPKAVYSFASVLNKNKIYVFGGNTSSKQDKNKEGLSQVQFANEYEIMKFLKRPNPISFNNFIGDIQTYDISNKKWILEDEKVINRAYFNAISYKDTVFLIGGKKLSKKKSRELLAENIELVSLKKFSIKRDKVNPHQAVDFGSVLYDNKILVFGGSIKQHKNGSVVFSDEIHFYDLKTGYWYLLTKMPKGKEVTGIVFNDKLYLFGGYNKKNLTEIESFDLKTGKWKKEGTLFRGMRKPAITKDKDFIYLNENGKIITFDPKTSTLKEYSIDLNLNNSNMYFFNETIYIVGGYHVEDYRRYPSSGLYSINVSEFINTKPINRKKLQQN